MKFKSLLQVSFVSILMLSCGGSDDSSEGGSEESSKAKYYIELGDEIEEGNSSNDVNYLGDFVADESSFKMNDMKLNIYGGFAKETDGSGPESVTGKEYPANIEIGENKTEGTAKISEVTESDEKKSFGKMYDMKGTFTGNGGEKGAFSVSLFHM